MICVGNEKYIKEERKADRLQIKNDAALLRRSVKALTMELEETQLKFKQERLFNETFLVNRL